MGQATAVEGNGQMIFRVRTLLQIEGCHFEEDLFLQFLQQLSFFQHLQSLVFTNCSNICLTLVMGINGEIE